MKRNSFLNGVVIRRAVSCLLFSCVTSNVFGNSLNDAANLGDMGRRVDTSTPCFTQINVDITKPALVFFYAEWARPAMDMKENLDVVKLEYPDVRIISVDMDNKSLAKACFKDKQWGMKVLPLLQAVNGGRFVGKPLERFLPKSNKADVRAVFELLNTH